MKNSRGSVVVPALVFGAVMLTVSIAGRGLVQSSRTAVRGLAESRELTRAARSAIAEAVARLQRDLERGAELTTGQSWSVEPEVARFAFKTRVEIGDVRVAPARAPDATFGTGGQLDLTVTVRVARAGRERASTVTERHGLRGAGRRMHVDAAALATWIDR